MYDTRLARRWNQDPKPNPSISNYATFANNPIRYTDPLGDTTHFYDIRGFRITTIWDDLPNEIHFMPVDYSTLSPEEVYYYRLPFTPKFSSQLREQSVAFIGKQTYADMRQTSDKADRLKQEVGFVLEVSSSRELRLKALPDSYGKDRTYDLSSAIQDNISKADQVKLFGVGHNHHKGLAYGYIGEKDNAFGRMLFVGKPSDPSDYQPVLYRQFESFEKGQSPAILTNPFGFTIYGTGSKNAPGIGVLESVKPDYDKDYYKFEFFNEKS